MEFIGEIDEEEELKSDDEKVKNYSTSKKPKNWNL